ncbi:hypothetical protein BDD14_5195 [Edaphobacter modestus]|uniref:Uncharacterized protein n=1 Tax=Edaphobacter modestus TaxID=388466 RepID=A0A4V2G555_9BACT|nr:hypothetical protein BDD14_5195 [Edaphobacter modestus]
MPNLTGPTAIIDAEAPRIFGASVCDKCIVFKNISGSVVF